MSQEQSPSSNFLFLLRISAFFTLGGYAWLSWTGKVPLSVFYWNEQWLGPVVTQWSGMSWTEYMASDAALRLGVLTEQITGIILAISAMAAWGGKAKVPALFLLAGALIILLFSVLYGIDKIFFWAQTPEYALQWGTPMLLALLMVRNHSFQIGWWLRMAVAVTFAAHGFYAMGVVPRPGHFTEMTMTILQVSQNTANCILTVAGILDCLAAAVVLFPLLIPGNIPGEKWSAKMKIHKPSNVGDKWQRAALLYMFVWGLLTTLARWAAHVHFEVPWWPQSFLEWTPEVLIRGAHFLVPLALLRR